MWRFGAHSRALMRKIDSSLVDSAIRSHAAMRPDLKRAEQQHEALKAALKSTGVFNITELPSDGFPDSVFIEDTAVYANGQVMVTTPAAEARQGETRRVLETLKGIADDDKLRLGDELYVAWMQKMDDEARLDGGDVLFTGWELIVGESARTNTAGINVLMECFPDMPVTTVDIRGCDSLHLKSACSMAGHSHIIFGGEVGEYISKVVARECTFLYENTTFVPDMEAANCIFVNDTLIRRADEEFPRSADALRAVGGAQVSLVADELAKVDGALTCCALLL